MLAERERETEETSVDAEGWPALSAWLDHTTATVPLSFVTGAEPAGIELLDGDDLVLARACAIECGQDFAALVFEDLEAIRGAMYLRSAVSGQRALVQHQVELQSRAAGSRRAPFEAALFGLETDAAQLEELFTLVSKVLEEPVALRDATLVARVAPKVEGTRKSASFATFEASIHDAAKARALPRGRRALVPSSDLAAIIEVLIYQLGVGRSADVDDDHADVVAGEEDDIPGASPIEDGRGTSNKRPDNRQPSGQERAKMCRQRIKTLLRRLLASVERLDGGADPLPLVVHAVVVIGILRHLRLVEASLAWRPRTESILPTKAIREFFDKMCPRLYASQTGLVDRALAGSHGVLIDELSTLHALMTWLASECGIDLADLEAGDLLGRDREKRWIALGRAFGPLAACNDDENSRALVARLTILGAPAAAWLKRHLEWSAGEGCDGPPGLGAILRAPKRPGRHVVVAIEPSKIGLYVLAEDRVVKYQTSALLARASEGR